MRPRRPGDLPETVVAFLLIGARPLDVESLDQFMLFRDPGRVRALWREYGAELTAAWVRDHAGSRPWGWWSQDAPEPRRCVEGTELLYPRHAEWAWLWHRQFGIPPFVQCRPRGYRGLPRVESEAGYLDRLNLLGAEERAGLPDHAFDAEPVDPFVTDSEELDRLLGRTTTTTRRTT